MPTYKGTLYTMHNTMVQYHCGVWMHKYRQTRLTLAVVSVGSEWCNMLASALLILVVGTNMDRQTATLHSPFTVAGSGSLWGSDSPSAGSEGNALGMCLSPAYAPTECMHVYIYIYTHVLVSHYNSSQETKAKYSEHLLCNCILPSDSCSTFSVWGTSLYNICIITVSNTDWTPSSTTGSNTHWTREKQTQKERSSTLCLQQPHDVCSNQLIHVII